jgi:hypothetical protein
MLNIFDLVAKRFRRPNKESSIKASSSVPIRASSNVPIKEPSQLELLRWIIGIRLDTVSVNLRLIDMLLEKLPEKPDNMDSARSNIDSAIETLELVLEDLKNYGS